jgi:hypothetical protein
MCRNCTTHTRTHCNDVTSSARIASVEFASNSHLPDIRRPQAKPPILLCGTLIEILSVKRDKYKIGNEKHYWY